MGKRVEKFSELEFVFNVLKKAEDFGYEVNLSKSLEVLLAEAEEVIENETDEEDIIQVDVEVSKDGCGHCFAVDMPDGYYLNAWGELIDHIKEGRQLIWTYVGRDTKLYHIYTTR